MEIFAVAGAVAVAAWSPAKATKYGAAAAQQKPGITIGAAAAAAPPGIYIFDQTFVGTGRASSAQESVDP